jgi:DNA-binding MarR family transcriptional regulator
VKTPVAKRSLTGRVRLNDHIPFLLYRLASQLSIEANAQFKALGVNTLSSRVLLVLLAGDAATVGDLSSITAIDQSTLSHILIRLGRKGLTIKRKEGRDSRIVNVRLTAKGRKAALRCREIGLQFAGITTASMSAGQKDDLRTMLKEMYRNLMAATREDG